MGGDSDDALVSDWLNSVSVNSARSYGRFFRMYLSYRSSTAAEAKDQKLKEKLTATRGIENEMEAWGRNLEVKGLSPASVSLGIHSVQSFFGYYGLQLGKVSPKLRYERVPKTAFVPTQEDIGRMLNVQKGSTRNRFLICGLAESGLSISDFLKLTWETSSPFWGSIRKQVETRDIIHIRLVRGKTKTPHDSFMGKICVSILREMKERKRPLVDMNPRQAKYVVEETAKRAKLPVQGLRFGPHQLRAYLVSTLEALGDRQDNPAGSMAHYWVGHKPNPIQKAYGASTNTRVEKQAEWYQKWESALEPKLP